MKRAEHHDVAYAEVLALCPLLAKQVVPRRVEGRQHGSAFDIDNVHQVFADRNGSCTANERAAGDLPQDSAHSSRSGKTRAEPPIRGGKCNTDGEGG